MATYSRSATIDTTQNADYLKESIDDIDTCVGGLITDLNAAHMTTQGDIIYRGASAVARLAKGSTNQVLTSDGTDPYWSGGAVSITADTTVADTTHSTVLIDSSSANVTLTLPAVTAAKVYKIQCIDVTNGCDIACNGSETIAGATTYYFTAADQSLIIQGDTTPATNTWRLLSENIPPLQDNASHEASGTNETDFGSVAIKQNAIKANDVVMVYGGGTITDNANGSATLKLYVGTTAITIGSIANVATEDWVAGATIAFTATNAQRVRHWFGSNSTYNAGYDTASFDTTGADTTIKMTGTKGNAGDAFWGNVFVVRLVR